MSIAGQRRAVRPYSQARSRHQPGSTDGLVPSTTGWFHPVRAAYRPRVFSDPRHHARRVEYKASPSCRARPRFQCADDHGSAEADHRQSQSSAFPGGFVVKNGSIALAMISGAMPNWYPILPITIVASATSGCRAVGSGDAQVRRSITKRLPRHCVARVDREIQQRTFGLPSVKAGQAPARATVSNRPAHPFDATCVHVLDQALDVVGPHIQRLPP